MIPAEAIADVKARHELVAFIEDSGVTLKRHGDGYLGLCRFHDDRNPSLSVSPIKQYWCCHGACSAGGKVVGGDVIEYARRLWDVSFPEALRRLGAAMSVSLPAPPPRSSSAAPLRLVRNGVRVPRPATPGASSLLSQVVALYHQCFLALAKPRDYVASRGLTNAEVLAALPMGYADGTLLDRVPEGSETHTALKAHGVLTGDGRELMTGCIVVPLRDLSGNVVNLYGRSISRDQHLYLPGPRYGLVNAACAATADELILTESIIDALSFLEAGIPNVVPLYGKNGFTPDHEALLSKYRIRRVVLALDNDEAGEKAGAALAEKLRTRGLQVERVRFP